MPYVKTYGDRDAFYSYKYKKNTMTRLMLNYTEYLETTVDEIKFNFSYSEILKQIEVGKIDPNQLGLKM
jgi:hypothetical protein